MSTAPRDEAVSYENIFIRPERLTIDMQRREYDAMYGSDGWEEQGSGQASVPQPVCLSSKDTRCYKNIVSTYVRRSVKLSPGLNLYIHA